MMNRLGIGLLVIGVLLASTNFVRAEDVAKPQVILLWPQGAPGAVGNETQDKPSLTAYLPPADKANGSAVVICPGGGYGFLAVDHEGKQVAEWLNSIGVAGFMLQYRIAPRYHHPAPLQDAQRAIRTVRRPRQGVAHRSDANRHLGFLGRRTFGVHCRDSLRPRPSG